MMFHFDVTMEDCRLIADGNGYSYVARFYDNLSGQSVERIISAEQLSSILAIAIHPNGQPQGYEDMYWDLEPVFKDMPKECRFIP